MIPAKSAIRDYLAALVGQKLTSIERHEFSWSFVFGAAATLTVEGSWRARSGEGILLSSLDHGQQFGLPAPLDVLSDARQRIVGRTVREIAAREGRGDLTIGFGDDLVMDVLNLSTGYEAWQISKPREATLIAKGGGKLVFF